MSKRPCLEARDQRAEFGEHTVDLRDAHLGEHRLGDFRRLAGQLAVGRCKAERRLIGEADADIAVGLGALQRGLRISRRQRGGGERKDGSGLDDRAAGKRRIDHVLLPLLIEVGSRDAALCETVIRRKRCTTEECQLQAISTRARKIWISPNESRLARPYVVHNMTARAVHKLRRRSRATAAFDWPYEEDGQKPAACLCQTPRDSMRFSQSLPTPRSRMIASGSW